MIRRKGYENLENYHKREYALIFWLLFVVSSYHFLCSKHTSLSSILYKGFSSNWRRVINPKRLCFFWHIWHFLIFLYRISPRQLFNPVLTICMSFDFPWSTGRTLSNGVICSHPDPIRHKFSKAGNVSGGLVRRYKQHLRPRFSQTYWQGPSMPASSRHTALPPDWQRTIFPMNLQKVADHTDLSWYHGIKDMKHVTDWSWLSHIIAQIEKQTGSLHNDSLLCMQSARVFRWLTFTLFCNNALLRFLSMILIFHCWYLYQRVKKSRRIEQDWFVSSLSTRQPHWLWAKRA